MPKIKGMREKQAYNKRLGELKRERQSWEPDWRDLQTYFMPKRGRFLLSETNRGDRAKQRLNKTINNSGRFAARTLASGLMAGVTSPARPWFILATEDPDLMEFAPVKEYLQFVERLMREVFNRSNLYQALPSIYLELGVIGTGSMMILPNFKSVIRCYPFTAGQYYLAINDELEVDTHYREFRVTVRQWMRMANGNVSAKVKNAFAQGNYEQWVDIIHAVEPNDEAKHNAMLGRDKAFKSVYYEKTGDDNLISMRSGFDSFPIVTPRWDLLGEDVYGFSAGMDALGDNMSLQVQEKRKAQAVDKMSSPPLLAPASMKNKAINQLPAGVTYYDQFQSANQQSVSALYQVRPDITALRDDMNSVENRINRAFFADLFLMLQNLDRKQITATEIAERHEEKLLALGPVLESLNNELLNPLIERTYNIMNAAEILPPPPEELQDQELKIEYISVLAQAQQQVGLAAIERFAGYVGNLSGLYPEVRNKFDAMESVDDVGQMLGVPQSLIKTDDVVQEELAAEAEQEQQMQAIAASSEVAQTAKNLSEAKTSDQNALTELTGL